jgi:MoaA/NifB/PqqE/SkfB family radical SAM enzyme
MTAIDENIKLIPISEYSLWEKTKKHRTLLSVTLEITARCNNECAHCYINLPANDPIAIARELKTDQLKALVDEAVSLGTLWFLLSGGEPLLRDDFFDIYAYIKRKGALISVFTNATLVTDAHVNLFKKYPPRDIEVSIYGVTKETYEKVTGKKTFLAAMRGVDRLIRASLPVTLKTTILKSNFTEIDKIARYCREKSALPFRFDPFLNLRIDQNAAKNERIKSERLSAEEIIQIEKKDGIRHNALKNKCNQLGARDGYIDTPEHLFRCQAGINSCCIGYDGMLKLCSILNASSCTRDLKMGSLSDTWKSFVPCIVGLQSTSETFKAQCGCCNILDLCMWCPANAHLETGELDGYVPYYCDLAHKRRDCFG